MIKFFNYILPLLLLTVCFKVKAQEYTVVGFDVKPTDLTATRQPVIDNNGNRCALLKIYADDRIINVEGGQVGDITSVGMEQRVYVPNNTKRVELYFQNHFPVEMTFEEYLYPALTGGMTYILKLKSDVATAADLRIPSKPQIENQPPVTPVQPQASQAPQINVAETVKQMEEAYNKGEYEKAFKLAKTIPDNTDAQFRLGYLYANGLGTDQDYKQAYNYYMQAANNGDAGAMNNIGSMYKNGQGVNRDYAEALKWFQKAADKNSAFGYYNIGYLYEEGLGVPQDYLEAAKWYSKAITQDHMWAMIRLAGLYDTGKGVAKSSLMAKQLLEGAAELGNNEAMYTLGTFYEYGHDMMLVNLNKALNWYKKAADAGNLKAPAKVKEISARI